MKDWAREFEWNGKKGKGEKGVLSNQPLEDNYTWVSIRGRGARDFGWGQSGGSCCEKRRIWTVKNKHMSICPEEGKSC